MVSLGAGGVSKLIGGGKILRLNNPKYAREYLDGWDKISENKRRAAAFQGGLARDRG